MSSIKAKLSLAFILVALVILAQSGITYFLVQSNSSLIARVVDKDFNGSLIISQLAIEAQKIRRYEKEYFIYIDNIERRAKYEREWTDTYVRLRSLLDGLLQNRDNLWSDVEQQEFVTWEASLTTYGNGFLNVVKQAKDDAYASPVEANAAIKDAKNAFRVFLDGTTASGAKKLAVAQKAATEVKSNSDLLTFSVMGIGLAGILVVILFQLRIVVSIAKPIRELTDAADTMSKGKLSVEIAVPSNAKEFEVLAQTLERLRLSQRTMMKRLMEKKAG